jgi:hypothetical protein
VDGAGQNLGELDTIEGMDKQLQKKLCMEEQPENSPADQTPT